MTKQKLRTIAAGLLCIAVVSTTGCKRVLGDNQPRDPDLAVPGGFASAQTGTDGSGESGDSAALVTWDALFNDPKLAALIDEALENNRELNMQLQDIIIAKAKVGERKGEYLPHLDAVGGVGLEKVGDRTSQGVSDGAHGVPKNLADFHFGLAASWEVDIWGRLVNAKKAADLRYQASVEAKNFLATQIVAEIARLYYELIAVDLSIDVLDRYIELTDQALEVVRQKKAAARGTELAVQRFEAELSRSKGRRFAREQQAVILENQINYLVGRYPQPVARSSELLDEQALVAVAKSGVPADLLENRPDLRQAKLRLEAAKLDAKSAKKAFYPSLTLEAGVGYESFNAAHLVRTPESLAYGVAAGLMAPLLNRAAIKAEYRTANAEQIKAVLEYEQTMLKAYAEVINELSQLQKLAEKYERFAEQVATLEKAVEVSNILYRSAHADYMEVLMTRRDALEAELDLIETELDRMEAVVTLYQALGGGWLPAQNGNGQTGQTGGTGAAGNGNGN